MVDFKYDKELDKDVLADIRKHLEYKANDPIEDIHKLDESNPHELAKKFETIKKNPPDPNFMKVDVFHGVDKNGKDKIYSKSIDFNGDIKWLEDDPMYCFSPYIGFKADIAQSGMHVVPMLLDEMANVVAEEKKAFKPEKRKDEKQWQWILFIVLAVVGAIGAGLFLIFK